MSNIFHLPQDIRQEFSIDDQGRAFASQAAVARLCGVSQPSINELLEKIAIGKANSESLEPFNGNDYRAIGKIPDLVVAAIINHYAMYARNTTSQAKKVSLGFQAIGIRTWIQSELGWQNEPIAKKDDLSIADAIALAEFGATSAIKVGVDPHIAEQIKLDSMIKAFPHSSTLLTAQKEAIAAKHPQEELPVTPTKIGKKLAAELGVEKISARAVNTRLLELGYQSSVTRIKRSNGKEVHDYYTATDKGKPYSQMQMTGFVDEGAKNTKNQLRWFESIISVLANNWETQP